MLPGKPFSHFFYIRNAIDTTIEVLLTATVDGGWVATGTIPSNWAVGDFIHLRIAAQASGYPMSDTTFLGAIEPDNSLLLNTIAANAEFSRQGVTNRYKIDEATNTGTLYNDDGTTPLVVHSLTDKDGNPATESTYERVPQ